MYVRHVTAKGRAKSAGEIFLGQVETQTAVGNESAHLRLTEVAFKAGARNRLHQHMTDQILLVTEGEGTLGGDREEHDLRPGDVAFISAGERHWHGAKPGRDMTHWSILGPGETKIVG